MSAEDQLKDLLVTNYSQIVAAYNALGSQEEKQAFLSLFEGFTEEEFLLGPNRVEHELCLVESEEEA